MFATSARAYAFDASKPVSVEKLSVFELYLDDQTGYPYEVVGKVRYEGLSSDEARIVLKKKAILLGADAIINYHNQKGPHGFTAEGLAVRFKGH